MKRFVALFLTIMICLLSATRSFATETPPQANAYIEVSQIAEDVVSVALYLETYENLDIAGMGFKIDYLYSYDNSLFSLRLDENSSNYYLNERFSGSIIGDNSDSGSIKYVWASFAESISANETILLAEFPLTITDMTHDGNYDFFLTCTEFYGATSDEDSGSIDFPSIPIETFPRNVTLWVGDKLTASSDSYEIVESGWQDILLDVYVNKNIDEKYSYIVDTSIAKITNIDNYDDGSGACITIIGKEAGLTELVLRGGYNNKESLTLPITVNERSPYICSISQKPTKTVYKVGETLDLSGMILKVTYDNYDEEYIYSGFVADTYELSSAGAKRVKINYGSFYVYIDIVVEADEPDVTPDILYGDANDDGLVDTKDLVLLRRYLANYNYDTGLSTVDIANGGDANGDNTVDTKDLVLIRRYLANYNYDTGSSTVVLGPQN